MTPDIPGVYATDMGAKRLELKVETPPEREKKPEPEKVFVIVNPQKNLRFLGWCCVAGSFIATALYILFINLVMSGLLG